MASDSEGNQAIKTTFLPKTGKSADPASQTKNIDYTLGPGETKNYRKTVRELLTKGQRLLPTVKQTVEVKLVLPVVTYQNGTYQVTQIESNSFEVKVDP